MVIDADGQPVGVTARLAVTGVPARIVLAAAPEASASSDCLAPTDDLTPIEITGWAGPWPVDERWWAAAEAIRRARFQVRLADGRALLLRLSAGRLAMEAVYD